MFHKIITLLGCGLMLFARLAGCNSIEDTVPGYLVSYGSEYTVVVTTIGEPSMRYWKDAGWQISDTPKSAEELTSDCTFYPLFGAINQWIGQCEDDEFVTVVGPGFGDEMIAILLISSDGTIEMVNYSEQQP